MTASSMPCDKLINDKLVLSVYLYMRWNLHETNCWYIDWGQKNEELIWIRLFLTSTWQHKLKKNKQNENMLFFYELCFLNMMF